MLSAQNFNRPFFALNDVRFGDLMGDGRDEAVVWLEEGSGTGHRTFGYVFTPTASGARRIGVMPDGDRADGGIGDLRIEGGRLYVERFGHDTGGSSDVEWVETEAWVVRDGTLACEDATGRRAYLDTAWGDFAGTMWGWRSPTVRFLRRSTRAALRGYVTPARPDRRTLSPRAGRDGAVRGVAESGGRARVAWGNEGAGTLVVTAPASSEYWLEIAWVDAVAATA